MKYFVYFINMGYASDREFDSVESAVAYAKSQCFDATICQGRPNTEKCKLLGSWTYFQGYRPYNWA